MHQFKAISWKSKLAVLKTYITQWWQSLKSTKIVGCTVYPSFIELAPVLDSAEEKEIDENEVARLNRLRIFCEMHGIAATLQRVFQSESSQEDTLPFLLHTVLCDILCISTPFEVLLEYEMHGEPYAIKYRFPEQQDVPFPLLHSTSTIPDNVYPSVVRAHVTVDNGTIDVTAWTQKLAGPEEDFYQGKLDLQMSDLLEGIGMPYKLMHRCKLIIEDDMGSVHSFTTPDQPLLLHY